MKQRKINYVNPIEEGKADDLFICCVSFEKRCVNSTDILRDKTKIRNAAIVRFEGKDRFELREENQRETLHNLKKHMEKESEPEVLWCDKADPLDGILNLEEFLKNIQEEPKRITIDITAFTKQYLLVLLYFLGKEYPNAAIRTLYTRGRYKYSKKTPLSWGIKEITAVPFFSFPIHPEKEKLLVLFLGYEGERAFSVYRTLEPDKTIAVIGYPPGYHGADIPSRNFNKYLLDLLPNENKVKIPSLDADKTKDFLEEIYEKNKNYNIFLAPLGTKMQTLGIYLSLRGYFKKQYLPNIQVIYAVPFWYDERHYTSENYFEGAIEKQVNY